MEIATEDLLGYGLYAVAYGTSILAFLMTRINWLRTLFVVSSGCYALYYYIVPAEPLWLDVISEGAFVLVNIFMLFYVVWASKRIKFSQAEKYVYDNYFATLDAHEFKKILSISEWKIFEPGVQLIHRGEQCKYLYCLFSGEIDICSHDKNITTRRTGSVLGELSYQLETTSTADAIVRETCVLLAIPQGKLRKLCKSKERVSNAVDALLSDQMANKLAQEHA